MRITALFRKLFKPIAMNDDMQNAYNRLTGLKLSAEQAQGGMNNFQKEAGGLMTDRALKHFADLNEMDADDIRQFGRIISEYTRSLAEDLNRLQFKVRKQSK
jgi:hypothetical protein